MMPEEIADFKIRNKSTISFHPDRKNSCTHNVQEFAVENYANKDGVWTDIWEYGVNVARLLKEKKEPGTKEIQRIWFNGCMTPHAVMFVTVLLDRP